LQIVLVHLCARSWKEHHHRQKEPYEAVTDYVRKGYNKAIAEKNSYIGFLMILMQRLVVSSTRAIRSTLERRLEALEKPEEQLSLLPLLNEEDWAELDGQEQVDALVTSNLGASFLGSNNVRMNSTLRYAGFVRK